MRIYPEQLAQQLSKGLRQAYLLCGNEPLLKLEASDQHQTSRPTGRF